MHPQRHLASSVPEYLHRVPWVGVHRTHDPAWHVGTDGDQTQVEGAAESSDVRKGRAVW